MLSQSTFKAELIAFRDSLKPPRPDEQGRLVGNRNSADLKLLDRWIARCDRENLNDAEKLWESLRDLMTAPELIRLVLQGRKRALAAVTQIYGKKYKGPSSDEIRRIREMRRAKDDPVQIVGDGKVNWRELEPIVSDFEIVGLDKKWRELKKKLTGNLSLENLDILERAVSLHAAYSNLVVNEEPRQRDGGGTRVKRLFWDFMGSYLQVRLGKRFDNDVAILTEIAFDLPAGSVSSGHIADARKQRH
jgi:hypothetical protein